MSFLSPLFLIGVLGASIPAVIHLYSKRKAVTYKFAAIDFILQAQNRAFGGTRFRNILLLVLRSLIIGFLAIAIAKPYITDSSSKESAFYNNTFPSANVLIMDDSFSMGYEVEGRQLFQLAKEMAKTVLDDMGVNDEVAIMFTSNAGLDIPSALPELKTGKDIAKKAIESSLISYTSKGMILSIDKANSLLSLSECVVKRLFIFTDFTKNGWGFHDNGKGAEDKEGFNGGGSTDNFFQLDSQVSTYLVNVSGDIKSGNVCVSDVDPYVVDSSDQNEFNVKVTINNFSDIKINNLIVQLFIDNDLYSQGFVNLDPWSMEIKEFLCRTVSDKRVPCRVEVMEESTSRVDHLDIDNVHHFILGGAGKVNVLIVDGDPGVNRYKSESFYLEKVISPDSGQLSHIKSRVMNSTEFESTELDAFDLIIFCNIEVLSNEKINDLESFVQSGGALLFAVGDKVKVDYYNDAFKRLLPYSLRRVNVFGSQSLDGMVECVSFERPVSGRIFHDIFSDLSDDDLHSLYFYKTFMINPGSESSESFSGQTHKSSNSSVILQFSNNLPALVIGKYGSGTTALFTSTFDRDWNNLPIKPLFLPIVYRLIDHLTQNFDIQGEGKSGIVVYDKWELPRTVLEDLRSRNIDSVTINGPDSTVSNLAIDNGDKIGKIEFDGTGKPGFYKIGDRPGLTNAAFVVNVDAIKESNLKKINTPDLERHFGDNNVSFITDVKNDKMLYGAGVKKNLWGVVLFLLICTVCFEAFIARRG